MTVVQLDAHGDLRDEYEESRYNHACVMRRVRERGIPTLAVGIRSLSREEGIHRLGARRCHAVAQWTGRPTT